MLTLLTKKRAKRTKNQSRARGRANRSREKKIGIVLLIAKIKEKFWHSQRARALPAGTSETPAYGFSFK